MPNQQCIGDVAVERLVTSEVRELQYQAARKGMEARHSVSIAANFSICYPPAKEAQQ
jgi:hypothetical protein